MINIGLLQADSIDPHYHPHSGGDYPDMFRRLFHQSIAPLKLTVFNAVSAHLPTDREMEAFDGFIITGSRHSAFDITPWVEALSDFIQRCHAQRKKLIGICFGHQIIAQALGGKVIRAPHGWGIGMQTITLKTQALWMDPFQPQCSLVFSHQDQVIELPATAQVIAESEYCAIQMYTLGQHILGIQGHPEMQKPHIKILMQHRQHDIGVERIEQGHRSLEILSNDGDIVGQWMVNFLLHR